MPKISDDTVLQLLMLASIIKDGVREFGSDHDRNRFMASMILGYQEKFYKALVECANALSNKD